jgi:hypothetical protein
LDRPALIVVDYADTRDDLTSALTQLPGGDRRLAVRVLLLARDGGEWWRQLRRSVEGQRATAALEGAGRIHLAELVTDHHDQQQVFEQAVDAFASRLGLRTPRVRLGELDPKESLLMIHTAALVAVLRAKQKSTVDRVEVSDGMWDELLEHEAGYWDKAQARFGLRMLADSSRRVVACAILLGADNEADAVSLLRRVPELALSDLDFRHRVAEWLHALYPTSADQWLGVLRPRQLAEHLVLTELKNDAAFAASVLSDLPESRLPRVLALFGSAAHRDMWARTIVEKILWERPAVAIPMACRVALTGIDLDEVIADCIADPAVALSADALDQMWTQLPGANSTRRLTRTVVASANRRVTATVSGSSKRAATLKDLCIAMRFLGNYTEATARGQEAVDLYRRLAEADSSADAAGFGSALVELSEARRHAGQIEQAVLDAGEAVELWRPLAEANPDANQWWLARALVGLSAARRSAGQAEQAVLDAGEAVELCRPLAEANPDAHQPPLAKALIALAEARRSTGQAEQAVLDAGEAVELWRPLAQTNPDANQWGLAEALITLAR